MNDKDFDKAVDSISSDLINIEDNKNTIVNKKQKVLEIKNKYVSANKTDKLFVYLDDEVLKILIKIKTQKYQGIADRAEYAVTKKIETILMRQIPKSLQLSFKKYNQCFIEHPGFLYKSSHHYGEQTMWIKPNIPYFFEQHTETDIILKYALYQRDKLDKLVDTYIKYAHKVLKQEAKIAVQLNGIKRIVDLLEYDVEYYLLYMDIVEKLKSVKK